MVGTKICRPPGNVRVTSLARQRGTRHANAMAVPAPWERAVPGGPSPLGSWNREHLNATMAVLIAHCVCLSVRPGPISGSLEPARGALSAFEKRVAYCLLQPLPVEPRAMHRSPRGSRLFLITNKSDSFDLINYTVHGVANDVA
jgi:hypothetical protein